jgi:hypothetical protein
VVEVTDVVVLAVVVVVVAVPVVVVVAVVVVVMMHELHKSGQFSFRNAAISGVPLRASHRSAEWTPHLSTGSGLPLQFCVEVEVCVAVRVVVVVVDTVVVVLDDVLVVVDVSQMPQSAGQCFAAKGAVNGFAFGFRFAQSSSAVSGWHTSGLSSMPLQ